MTKSKRRMSIKPVVKRQLEIIITAEPFVE